MGRTRYHGASCVPQAVWRPSRHVTILIVRYPAEACRTPRIRPEHLLSYPSHTAEPELLTEQFPGSFPKLAGGDGERGEPARRGVRAERGGPHRPQRGTPQTKVRAVNHPAGPSEERTRS